MRVGICWSYSIPQTSDFHLYRGKTFFCMKLHVSGTTQPLPDVEAKLAVRGKSGGTIVKERTISRGSFENKSTLDSVMFDKKRIPLNEDTIIVDCNITVLVEGKPCEAKDVPRENLIMSFLASPEMRESFSDITVVSAAGDRIPFYKLVLAARSPVFRAMLDKDKDFAEAKKNEITIIDFGTASLKIFLDFLVTNKINLPEKITEVELPKGTGEDPQGSNGDDIKRNNGTAGDAGEGQLAEKEDSEEESDDPSLC